MKQLGLIGYPLTHSFSKKYFSEKFKREGITDIHYELFSISSIEELPRLLATYPNLIGLNVTIPYKEQVLPYLDEQSAAAKKIGAVNCIQIREGRLKGYNTDVIGFEQSLLGFLDGQTIDNALILGTGGASKAVMFVLEKLNIHYKLVSRNEQKGDLTYSNITSDILSSHRLIVNTTPLGTYPNVASCPQLNYQKLDPKHYLYDLVYNPEKSLFLENGEKQGAKICNGSKMLVLQAEAGWEIWNK